MRWVSILQPCKFEDKTPMTANFLNLYNEIPFVGKYFL